MARVLAGQDITTYAVTGYGPDGNPSPGQVVGVIGVYKDITVVLEKDWVDVTPSAQRLKEKRCINVDWNATLEHQIRSGGAVGFSIALNQDLISGSFAEENSGKLITFYGGIARDTMKRPRAEATDTMEVTNTGYQMNSQGSLFYQ